MLWKIRGRLWMMTTIMAMQGFSGHVAVNAYLKQIISDGGLSTGAGPFAIGVDSLRVVATVIAGLTVERFGRKKLFVGGGLVQVCQFELSVTRRYTATALCSPGNSVATLCVFLSVCPITFQRNDLDIWHGGSSSSYLDQSCRSRSYVTVQGHKRKMLLLRLKTQV